MRSLRCRRDSSIFYLCVETATLQLRVGPNPDTAVAAQPRGPNAPAGKSLAVADWLAQKNGWALRRCDSNLTNLVQTSGLTAHMLDLLFR
jgi:hypothetical protein